MLSASARVGPLMEICRRTFSISSLSKLRSLEYEEENCHKKQSFLYYILHKNNATAIKYLVLILFTAETPLSGQAFVTGAE